MPGQGAQYIGMGKTLYDNFEEARLVYQEADESLGYSLSDIIFKGDKEQLSRTENVQPAILTTSLAFYRTYLQRLNLVPEILAGHSLGEFSALTAAGAITLSDAVQMVHKRGQFMQKVSGVIGEGAMAAVSGLTVEEIENFCNEFQSNGKDIVISNYNTREQTVISGLKKDIDEAGKELRAKGAIVIPLRNSVPFHSPYMKSAAEAFYEELSNYTFHEMKHKVICGVTGLPYQKGDSLRDLLTEQITAPIQWTKAVDYMLDQEEIPYFLEMGPGSVLGSMINRLNKPSVLVKCIDVPEDQDHFLDEINEKKLFNKVFFIGRILGIAVSTQNRNFNSDAYQKGVVLPYKEIRRIYDKYEAGNEEPTVEELSKCIQLLEMIFDNKETPQSEREMRYKQLENDTLIKVSRERQVQVI